MNFAKILPHVYQLNCKNRTNQGQERSCIDITKTTHGDKHVQQGQVEARRPNRVYQRKDLPGGDKKARRGSASVSL